ncbi:MAG: glycoside hydrolase family 99-like domain-containing protein [Clostridia bacterium]|nr:glycoside hydrolase family 99-like domain-containing protein [Clostridia bacterium]
MYNIKFNSYIPEPQPANSDRIVAAHYYAAWKKGVAGIHEGFDDLAEEFPDRTPLMGYYDEENPEVCDWEIKWAVEHGINCFIHCWYRKLDNVGKPVTVNDLRCGHGLHEALFNAKFRNLIKFAIMYETSPRWGGTDEKDMPENLMPFWMENYFKRENYLVIDNKPVLFVYNQSRLDMCFESAESQKKAFDSCREYAKKSGFDGMVFAVCSMRADKDTHQDLMNRGYDCRFGYNSGYNSPYDFYPYEDEIVEEQCRLFKENLEISKNEFIPTPSCFQDPTPRFSERWNNLGYKFREWSNIWYLSPEKYRCLIKKMKEITETLPENAWGRKIMMIDNCNEWDEGHFVAPSHKFGFKYLQAIREELTDRSNLPDYITPRDQGFGDYNTSWKTPDFAEVCKKMLNNKK